MSNPSTDTFLTTDEACTWLKVSRFMLYRFRKAGTIRAYFQFGKRGAIRYSASELRQAFLKDDKDMWDLYKSEAKAKRRVRDLKRKKVVNDASTSTAV